MAAVTAEPATLPAIEISQQTTYLTGPLRADGSVDYAQASDRLASEGVTAENNAAVLLCQAFGPAEIPREYRGMYFAGLGIDPLPENGTYLLSLTQYVQQHHAGSQDAATEQQSQAMEGPWSRQQYPLVAEWLEGIQQPLDVLVQGTRRAKYYSPLILSADHPLEWALSPLTHNSPVATRALMARAMLHLQAGDVEPARQDILAIHRLSRLLAQGPSVIDALVAMAVDGLACQVDAVLANSPWFTNELATSYLADLQTLINSTS